MAYEIKSTTAGRCDFDTVIGARCALAQGHQGHLHVTPQGDYFAERGGKVFGPVLGYNVTAGVDYGFPPAGTKLSPEFWADVASWTSRAPVSREELATKADNDALVTLEQAVLQVRELAENLSGRLGVLEGHRLPENVEAFKHTMASFQRQLYAERTHHVEHSAAVRNLREELERKLTALHRVEYGGGLAGMRRDVNRLVGLVGDEAWNGRKELATAEDLAGTDKAVAHLNDRLSALENQTVQLGKLAQCSASNRLDGAVRPCIRVNHHDGTHLGEDGFAW